MERICRTKSVYHQFAKNAADGTGKIADNNAGQ